MVSWVVDAGNIPMSIESQGGDMPGIMWLKDVDKEHEQFLGEKIVALAMCSKAGLPVPKCFIITPSVFYEFVRYNGIGEALQGDYRTLNEEDVLELDNMSKRMQKNIFSGGFPEDFVTELKEAYQRMSMHEDVYELSEKIKSLVSAARGDSKVVVKTIFGDAPFIFSKAIYNVRGINTLKTAVLRAWTDAFQAENIYMLKKVGASSFKISVVVQEMVNAEKTCRAFTFNPLNCDRNGYYLESCYGFGLPLTDGEFKPDYFVISKDEFSVLERGVAEKRYLYAADPIKTELRREALNGSLERSPSLSQEELRSVGEILKEIETKLGRNCLVDIAFQRGRPYVVSITPIDFLNCSAERETENATTQTPAAASPGGKVISDARFLVPKEEVATALSLKSSGEITSFKGRCAQHPKGVVAIIPALSPDYVIISDCINGVISAVGGLTSRLSMWMAYRGRAVCLVNDTSLIEDGGGVKFDPKNNQVTVFKQQDLDLLPGFASSWVHRDGEMSRMIPETEVVSGLRVDDVTERLADLITAVKVGVLLKNMEGENLPTFFESVLIAREAFENVLGSNGVIFSTPYAHEESVKDGDDKILKLSGAFTRILRDNFRTPFWVECLTPEAGADVFAQLGAVSQLLMKGYRNVGIVLPSFVLPHEFENVSSILKHSHLNKGCARISVLIDRPGGLFMGEIISKAGIKTILLDVDRVAMHAFNTAEPNTGLSTHKGFLNMISAGMEHLNEHNLKVMVKGKLSTGVDVLKLLVEHGVDCIFVEKDRLAHTKYLVARYERMAFLELLKHRHRLFRK